MPVKTVGAEFKAFYADLDFWPESGQGIEVWHEEMSLQVNDQDVGDDFDASKDLKDNDRVKIVSGWVLSSDGSIDVSLESYFKRWRKQQTTTHLAVAVPNDKLEAVKAAILAAGGKII